MLTSTKQHKIHLSALFPYVLPIASSHTQTLVISR